MGKRWTFFGKDGIYGKASESIYIENPWSDGDASFVVPYYFDTSHSMTEENRQDLDQNLKK